MFVHMKALYYGAEGLGLEYRLGSNGKLSLSTQQYMGTFFEPGKNKAP